MLQVKTIFAATIFLVAIGTVGTSYGFVQQDNTDLDSFANSIKFVGHTDGWAIIDGEAQRASMSFMGDGILDDQKIWKLQADSRINSDDGIDVHLIGSANPENGKIRLTGYGTGPNNIEFIVILRGNFAPIENLDNAYALDWTYAAIHWINEINDNLQLRLFQDGFIFVK